ncbi:hypothetical protein TMatcc_010053 [Talaromyces marneffei ATCC 18224]
MSLALPDTLQHQIEHTSVNILILLSTSKCPLYQPATPPPHSQRACHPARYPSSKFPPTTPPAASTQPGSQMPLRCFPFAVASHQ